MKSSRADWLIFLALGFMWGSSYLFIKIGVESFGTFTLIALRLAIGAAVLWTVVRIARGRLPRERGVYGHLVVMSLINITIPFVLITWAERDVESALAAILNSLVPLFVVVLAPLVIEDEPLRVNGIAGMAIGFAGVVTLMSHGLTGALSDLGGDIALIGSSLSYAAGAVYSRRNIRGLSPMIPAVFQVTFAMLTTATVAMLVERPWEIRPTVGAAFAIVWLGVLGSGVAYLAFFRLLGRWGATRTAMVAYELPVVGIILGYLVLAEPIDLRTILGTALIVGGVALVNSRRGRRPVFGQPTEVAAVSD